MRYGQVLPTGQMPWTVATGFSSDRDKYSRGYGVGDRESDWKRLPDRRCGTGGHSILKHQEFATKI